MKFFVLFFYAFSILTLPHPFHSPALFKTTHIFFKLWLRCVIHCHLVRFVPTWLMYTNIMTLSLVTEQTELCQAKKKGYTVYIGIKHGFSCINICQVHWEVLKTEASLGFQHLPRDLANVNALKNHVWSLLLHKNWKHLHYFLHYFVLPFHRCLTNVISADYARSRAGQYTSRNGSKSVAPVRSYRKLRSRALTVYELPC